MADDTDPLVFPDMPDEAVVAIDQFLEAFYHHFQNRYGIQLHRWYTRSISERVTTIPCRRGRFPIHRSENKQ